MKILIRKFLKYFRYYEFKIAFKWIFMNDIICKLYSKSLRHSYLRLLGSKIGKNSVIYRGGTIWRGNNLNIADGCNIGYKVHLDDRNGINIGKNVTIASEVMIWTMHHDYNDVNFKTEGGAVNIEDYSWICSRVIILPNVTIGEGAVVASGAVVSKNVDPWTVVGGIPAKKIGDRKKLNYDYVPGKYRIPFI